jgi:adenosylmethionine-8-amino-7-oxononanoate aminotransferase
MGQVFHRDPGHKYPVAMRGDGGYIVDKHGKRYLDATSGGGTFCLGHGDREVTDAIAAQLRALAFAPPAVFSSKPMEGLSCELIEGAPEGLARVWFCASGGQAVTAAVAMARQYHAERGEPQRRHVIVRRESARAEPAAMALETSHVSPCHAYRGRRDGEDDMAYGRRLSRELEVEVQRIGPDNVAAFVAETVSGFALGCATPVPGYFHAVRELCDRHGMLLIVDETLCGIGRCGARYACEQQGLRPDLIALGGALAAGYQPIGAVVVSGRIYDAIISGSGVFGERNAEPVHAVACAGALAVQRAIKERDLIAQVRDRGGALEARLTARFSSHRHVGDLRGCGLFRALELVEDRESRRPFEAQGKLHARIAARALENELLCLSFGGCVDGVAGDHVVLAPPYVVTDVELDEIVDRLGRSIDQAIADFR